MSSREDGKVTCPKCGAVSRQEGFGKEETRKLGGRNMPHSQEPIVTKRRERAAALRKRNGS
jgi:uncharacterized Zn finger protein (UPF0148 family)